MLAAINFKNKWRYLAAFAVMLFCMADLHAHPDDEIIKLTGPDAAWLYFKQGFIHILPLGLDHILFVMCIFLMNPKLKPVLWQATAFTVAHSITLGLAMCGVIDPPSYIIEPLIALSIVFIAVENIITPKLNAGRVMVVFAFGLVHGLGFAGALGDLGLPSNQFFTSLLTFNLGVEIGQVTVILIAWLLIGKWMGDKTWYRSRVVYPLSAIIAVIALYWTIERAFLSS